MTYTSYDGDAYVLEVEYFTTVCVTSAFWITPDHTLTVLLALTSVVNARAKVIAVWMDLMMVLPRTNTTCSVVIFIVVWKMVFATLVSSRLKPQCFNA